MNKNIKDLSLVALFVAIISVCSFVSVPFGAVPFTLQLLGVFCAVDLLGTRRGFLSVVCYLGLGVCGLPVFNGFHGGIGIIFGATGGFLLSFLIIVPIIGAIINRFGRKFITLTVANLFGMVINHIFGCLWYCFMFLGDFTLRGVLSSFVVCSLPFLIPDILKSLLAAFLTNRLKKFVEK